MEPKIYEGLPNFDGQCVLHTDYAALTERNRVLVEALKVAERFVEDEKACRGYSFSPEPDSDETELLADATETLDTIRAALANEPAPDQVETEATHDRS